MSDLSFIVIGIISILFIFLILNDENDKNFKKAEVEMKKLEMHIRLDKSEKDKLNRIAAIENRSASNVVETWIKNYEIKLKPSGQSTKGIFRQRYD